MPSEEQDEQTGAGAPITRATLLRQSLAVAGSVAMAPHLLQPLASGSRRATAPRGQVIDAFTQEAVNFNPLLYVNTGVETAVEYSVFDAPWKIDKTGRFIPNLATEIPSVANGGITENGRVWTLRFRRGVTWHDGAPFTSKDVKFTFETIMNPKVVVRSTAGHDHVADFSTPDRYTARIKLKSTFAPYLVVWQKTSVIPEHILAHVRDINTASFNTNPVGTGPFKFKDRVAGDHISFVANPRYHGTGPYLQALIQKVVPDQQVLYVQFQTGEVTIYDLQGIPPELYSQATALPSRHVAITAQPFVEFIYFNLGKPQFREKVVRQALYLAMDKRTWINTIYYGIPKRTLSYLPPGHWAYNRNLKDPGYNPARAAAMLDRAGWRVGQGGIREKNGVRLSFKMSTTAGNKAREQAQQLLQQNLKQVGVELIIHNMPASVVWGDYTVKSQFDTLMVGWDPLLYPDPDYTARIAGNQIPIKDHTGSNYVQYQNPTIDHLCAAGVATTNVAERKRLYDRIQEILLDDLPFAPIFAYNQITGTLDTLHNYKPNGYAPVNSWNNNEWRVS
jgi:peptide/nickel transport system substrate-binding protein